MRGHDEQTTHMFSYLSPEQARAGGAKLDHRGGGKLDHPAVEWLKAAVRRRGQDAGAAAGWRAFLLCSRR